MKFGRLDQGWIEMALAFVWRDLIEIRGPSKLEEKPTQGYPPKLINHQRIP